MDFDWGSIDWAYWIGAVVAVVLILAGLVGAIVPYVPATPLIAIGALVYGWVTDFTEITVTVLVALGIIAVLAQLMDFLASSVGAKKFGSSRWGVVGAIVGSVIGVFVGGPIGLAVFPFIGAFLLELLVSGSSGKQSLRVAFGSLIGVLGGIVMQLVFGVVMVAIIVLAVL